MTRIIAAAAVLALALSASTADAKSCRDATGKFVKCPEAVAVGKCRDKTTKKFANCAAPNTEPVPATSAAKTTTTTTTKTTSAKTATATAPKSKTATTPPPKK